MKNILFDLDGTIINPKTGITNSIRYALKKLNFISVPEPDELTWCIGPPLSESFSILLSSNSKSCIDEAIRLYRVNYNREGIYQFTVYDRIIETVKGIKNIGCRVYIATSKPRVMAVKITEYLGISQLFNNIYGAELNGVRGGKGELISFLLEKEAISADNVIMVGDRKHDIIGAKENGILSCGVCYGYGSEEELISAGADFLVKNPLQLIDIISLAGFSRG